MGVSYRRGSSQVTPRLSRIEEDKHYHLLEGLMVCGHCGKYLTPHRGGKVDSEGNPYHYYICTSVTKEGAASECGVRSVPARRMDELIISLFAEMGKHPDAIARATAELQSVAKKEVGPLKGQLEKLTKEIKPVNVQVDRLTKLAQNPESGDFGGPCSKKAASRRRGGKHWSWSGRSSMCRFA